MYQRGNFIRMDPFYVGAYWGARPESSHRCAERFARCAARLGDIDEVLGSWYRQGANRAAAKMPVDLDPEPLSRLLSQGQNRRDVGGEVIQELGFSFALWNGAIPAVGMSGTVGAHPATPGVLNSFVLDLPPPSPAARRLYEPRAAEAVFDAVIEAWEPDWATWTSHALRSAQDAAPREPVVGWITYLCASALKNSVGIAARPLLRGVVIRVGEDVTGAEEKKVLAMRARLSKAGVLRPIPYDCRA